jgi:hypothetical protein
MNDNRLWMIGAGLLSATIVALGWFLGVSPQLTALSAANAEIATVKALNEQQQLSLANMQADFANLDGVRAELDELRLSIPARTSYPDFLRDITKAADSQVFLTGMTAGAATIFTAPEVETPPAETPVDGETAGETPEETTPAPAAPIETNDGFIAIPVTISFESDVPPFVNMMGALLKFDRLFLVTNISSAPKGESGDISDVFTTTVTGFIYVMIDPSLPVIEPPLEDLVLVPVPEATETPGATQTPTPGSTSTPAP